MTPFRMSDLGCRQGQRKFLPPQYKSPKSLENSYFQGFLGFYTEGVKIGR